MGIVKKKYTKSLPDQRRCTLKSCRKHFTPLRDGQFVCSYECSVKYSKELKDKAEKKDKLNWQKEKKKRTDELKTHSDWSKELQDEINTIARLIDNNQPCISCQKSTGSQRHGGHRWRTSTYPEIRFNLNNVFSQCAYCNDYLSGNSDGFDVGLKLYFGIKYYKYVFSGMKAQYPILKLSIPELIHAKARAKKIVKGLKELNATFTPEQRIELRRKYNKILGLYV